MVRLLELPPLPYLGRISYGMYLWYWPTLLVTSGGRLDWGTYELFALRVVLTVALAALSFELVEKPIRSGALRRWRMATVAPIGAAAALGAVLVSTLVPVGSSALQGEQLHAPVAGRTAAPTVRRCPTTSWSDSATTRTSQGGPRPEPLRRPTQLRPSRRLAEKPIKVLLVGDSLAGSLGVGLALEARQYGVQVVNEGSPSCSVSMQGEIQVLWYTVPPGSPCDIGGNPDSLLTTWRQWVDAYNPDVVVYLARGETFNQQVGGAWQNLGEPAFDSYVGSRFNSAARSPRLPGRRRGVPDGPLLRQWGLRGRYTVAGGQSAPGGDRQCDHAPALRRRRRERVRVRPERVGFTGWALLAHRGLRQCALR